MSLTQQIETDLIAAMKNRDQVKLDALRMIQAAFKNEQIAIGHELSDDEAQKVLNRQLKQRTEAAEQYKAGGRQELAEKEQSEAELIKAYLPAQMTDEELEKIVRETLTESGINSVADMGKAVGAVMKKVAGQADGSRVSALVKTVLSE